MKSEDPASASPALQLIDFWRSAEQAIPPRLLERAKQCVLDAIGCSLFGYGRPWGRIMADEIFADGFCRGLLHVNGADLAGFRFYQRDNTGLVRVALAIVFRALGCVAVIGFIGLNDFAFATHRGRVGFDHGFADAVRKEPR